MCQSFRYTRVLNRPLVLNMLGFWIYQSSEMPGLHRVQTMPESFLNIPDYVWMSEYAWIYDYTGICLNMPKSAWMAFVLHFSTSSFVLQFLFYFFEWLQETRGYNLKEHEVVFLKRQNLIFFYRSWKYFIFFILD